MKKVKKIKDTSKSIFPSSKGFTLLELLVVVLIIGILAGIALPQYTTSVEKAKAAEALMNMRTIVGAAERYILSGKSYAFGEHLDPDNWDIELSGGTWHEYNQEKGVYITDNFKYLIGEDSAYVYALRCNGKCQNTEDPWEDWLYRIEFYIPSIAIGTDYNNCSAENDKGKKICKALEGLGIENNS